jgi:hypothetical protein
MLRQLIETAADTRFGKVHRFDLLRGLPDARLYQFYRRQVPIRTYHDFWHEYFRHYCQEGKGGRRLRLVDVTWPGIIPFFCETSGTTAPSKLVPFTERMFAENRRAALEMMACYLARCPESRLPGGKLLYMAGSTALFSLGDGICSGDMSGITLARAPFWLRPFVLPDSQVSALPWEEKLESFARSLLHGGNVRAISGVPPWILLLLKRCREMGEKPLPELLPGLELILHGGTSMKPYAREFNELFAGQEPNMLELLPSSEAFMAFQLPGEEHMRLMPYYGAFYEFVPVEDLDERGVPRGDAGVVPLEGVETGRRYAVILSTCAGLWRYHLGDTLRFLDRETLMIEFTGRDKFLDRFEEKVTQGEVEDVVAYLNGFADLGIREFIVGPDIPGRRHDWVLAMKGAGSCKEDLLAAMIDTHLRRLNADYGTFRSQGRIAPPRVTVVAESTIYDWSRNVRGKLGGQNKIPHVDPTLDGTMIASLHEFLTH